MSVHPLKKFLYHHTLTAKMYNVIRSARRDKDNRLSDEEFAKKYYKMKTGMDLNLENPTRFNEKLWYLKLHEKHPLMTKCSDKYLVREYVRECGLEHILNEMYGAYDRFEDIPFDELPDRFFIKCNHTSGVNAIIDKKKGFDYKYLKNEFDFWMNRNYFYSSREWNYKNIDRKIVCEKIMTQPGKSNLDDYRFMCFKGEVKMVYGDIDACAEDGSHYVGSARNIYDRDFNLMEGVRVSRENFDPAKMPKPKNYDKMVEYAEILSKPFRHVRVDLYNLDGEIRFGELTFYHQGACSVMTPDSFDYEAAEWLDITGL